MLFRSTQALQQAERSFRSIFENAVEGIFQTTPDGRYLNVNPALARIYGYETPAELMGSIADIQHQVYRDPKRRGEFMNLMRKSGAVTNFVSEIRRKDGQRIWISENARAVRDEHGQLMFYEGTVEDVTESKLAQEKLQHIANHDPVTSLPNRILMNDRLRQMMLQAQRAKSIVAVALVDLDHFKLINDTFGHNRGDQLLQTMAHRMLACVRDTDTVVRLGGDEFVLLLSRLSVAQAEPIVRRLSERLPIEASFGLADWPLESSFEESLKVADAAMYDQKRGKRRG
mgnify:CR=1 FL=1